MGASASDRGLTFRRCATAGLAVFLSIALPIGLVIGSVYWAMSGKPVLHPSGTDFMFGGTLANGELWLMSRKYLERAHANPIEFRMARISIQTGEIRDAGQMGQAKGRISHNLLLVNGELYATGAFIYRVVGGVFEKVAELPRQAPGFHSRVFIYHDRLTTVVATNDGEFRLNCLIDDKWVKGSRIFLPPYGTQWEIDSQKGTRLKLPETTFVPTRANDCLVLSVVQNDEKVHLFVGDNNGDFVAYRNGFEFVDESENSRSALTPAFAAGVNTEKDGEQSLPDKVADASREQNVNGWEAIQPQKVGDDWLDIRCDRDGVLAFEQYRSGRVVRRDDSGNWRDLDGVVEVPRDVPNWSRTILVDEADGTSYVLDSQLLWSSAVLYPIYGNTVGPPRVLLPGSFVEYSGRWQRIFAGILFAWLLHVAILIASATWVVSRAKASRDSLDLRKDNIASIRRRAAGFLVDALLVVMVVVLLVRVQLDLFEVTLKPPTVNEISQSLFNYESAFVRGVVEFPSNVRLAIAVSITTFVPPILTDQAFASAVILELLTLLGVKIYIEGRFGLTPGKWLSGIRTVRTTMRPCGFARALLRNLLFWFDIPLFVTPIPAAISIMFSSNRQRLGDRLADTIVVNARSLRKAVG